MASTMTLGAYVQPETELFRLADPAKVPIEAAVGPVDAQRIAVGDRAIVKLPGGQTVEASVRAVTPTLNGETRSATAAALDARQLHAFESVTSRMSARPGGA